MTAGERAAVAAMACVGVRFRPRGRDRASGLDCVGVAAIAARAAGWRGEVPEDYALRTGTFAQLPQGLRRCCGGDPGDILLCRVAATQLHLVVRTAGGFVHAEVAVRRVVARPGSPPWPVIAAWRVADSEGK